MIGLAATIFVLILVIVIMGFIIGNRDQEIQRLNDELEDCDIDADAIASQKINIASIPREYRCQGCFQDE